MKSKDYIVNRDDIYVGVVSFVDKDKIKVFGYGEKLIYDDIVEIKNKFFDDFLINNCELLGRYETDPNSTGYETYDINGNHHTFNLVKKDSLLPDCYFSMLWYTRNYKNIDVFIPNKLEGPIKSL